MFTFFFLYSIFNSERTFFFTSRLITSYIDLRSVIHLSLSSALCHQTTPIFFLLAPFHLLELFLSFDANRMSNNKSCLAMFEFYRWNLQKRNNGFHKYSFFLLKYFIIMLLQDFLIMK